MGQTFIPRPADPDRKRVSDEAYSRAVRNGLACVGIVVALIAVVLVCSVDWTSVLS